MRLVSGLPLLLASSVLAVALAGVPASTASELQPIAESSQVKLTGSVSAGQLTPRPHTRERDGAWRGPLPPAAPRSSLDLFVLHDGIREVLSGSLPAPAAIG